MEKGRLSGPDVGVITCPGTKDGRLQCTAEGEAQFPRLGSPPVQGVQAGRGLLVCLATGEEDDSRHGRGHSLTHDPDRRLGDLVVARLFGAVITRQDHVRFQQTGLQDDAVAAELLVTARSVATLSSAQRSRLCVPSISTSGSTMGVKPASCASAA